MENNVCSCMLGVVVMSVLKLSSGKLKKNGHEKDLVEFDRKM